MRIGWTGKVAAVAVIAGAVAACATANDNGADDAARSCPVIDGRDWRAWVNAQPGPDAPTLIVEGVVDMPTPGYSASWTVGPADRRLPPAQYLNVSFAAPDGAVIQVVTPTPVRFETEAVYPEYRAVIIRCGDEVLAQIDEVPVAQ